MRLRSARFVYSLVTLTAVAVRAAAAGPTGDLETLVGDEAGRPLQGVALTIYGTGLLGVRSAKTGPDGRFVFRALSPGTFEVDAALDGHRRIRREGVVVDAGRTATVPIVLQKGSLEESVTVHGREPLIDAVRTVSQVTFDREYLEHVPVGLDARGYTSVFGTAAGVVGSQVRGSSFTDNVYLVDGADSNFPYFSSAGTTVIPSAIEQVVVQTGAFSSEFGRATGGVANVVTKSGGNEFAGTLDLRYGSGGMLSEGEHFDPDAIGYARKVGEIGVGGPIVRDKLWFFVAGGYYGSEDAPPGSPTTADRSRTTWLGKLTWQAAPSHTLTALGMQTPQDFDDYDSSPLVAPEATSHLDTTNRFVSLSYLGVLGPRLVVQAQVANFRAVSSGAPQSGDLGTRCAVGLLDGTTTRNSCLLEDNANARDVLLASATWQLGGHALRAGIDLQRVETGGLVDKPGDGIDTVAPDGSGATVTVLAQDLVSPAGLDLGGDLHAAFLQDEWRVHPRVTLHLGLRYSDAAYVNDAGRKVIRTDLVEPRIGIAWDVGGSARDVLKGTWSRFGYSSTLEVVHQGNQNMGAIDYYANETVGGYFIGAGPVPFDLDGDGIIEERAFLGSAGGPTGVVYANGGRLESPRTDEWSLSYDRQLGSSVVLGGTYVRRRTTELIEDYFDEGLGAYVIDNYPGLLREYEGVELRLRAQWPRGLAQASYVWSKTRGNQDFSIWPGVSAEYDFPALATNRWGYMSTDTRHALKANGFFRLPLAFEIAYGFTYVSGYAWTVERNVLPYGSEYPEGRGSRRLPHFSQLDLDFSRNFRIRGAELRLIASVLNVFDREAVTAVNTLEESAGEPVDYQRPRRFEVGLRCAF